jgi:hypothetical protein
MGEIDLSVYTHTKAKKSAGHGTDPRPSKNRVDAGLRLFPCRQRSKSGALTPPSDGDAVDPLIRVARLGDESFLLEQLEVAGQCRSLHAEPRSESADRQRPGLDQGGEKRELRDAKPRPAQRRFEMLRDRAAGAAQQRTGAALAGGKRRGFSAHNESP